MKNTKNQDERIIAQRRKIQSDAYRLLVYALLISIVVQQFFLQAPPSQYTAEFLCLMCAGVYNIIHNVKIGNNLLGESKDTGRKIIKNTLLSGILSVAILAFLRGEININNLVSYYLTFVVFFGGMNYLFYYLGKMKEAKINKELDMYEDDLE